MINLQLIHACCKILLSLISEVNYFASFSHTLKTSDPIINIQKQELQRVLNKNEILNTFTLHYFKFITNYF